MEYRQLGRSGLKVSLHALGTMNFASDGMFGKIGSVATARGRSASSTWRVDHGVNLLDTSNVYTTGKSEEAVGEILKGRSSQILVGTKVRFSMGKGPNEQGLSRFHIIEQCEASLKRLKRDRIDIYYLHQWDGQTPVEETMEALDTLVKQGKIRYAGCSNFSGWHIMKCLMAAGAPQPAALRVPADPLLASNRATPNMSCFPSPSTRASPPRCGARSPGGLLSGKFRRNAPPPQLSRHLNDWGEPPIRDENRLYRIIEALVEVGDAHGVSAAQVALAWLARQARHRQHHRRRADRGAAQGQSRGGLAGADARAAQAASTT